MKNARIGSLGLLLSLMLSIGCSIDSSEGDGGESPYAQSTLQASRLSGIPANGRAQVTFTFTLLNTSLEPVPGVEVEFRATGENNDLSQEEMFTNAQGVVAATLKSRKAEAKVISVVRTRSGEEVQVLPSTLTVYFGDLFGEALRFAVGEAPRGLVATDFNQDGYVDVATASGGDDAISILSGEILNDPDLVQSHISQGVGEDPRDLAIGDLDGDGDIDIVSVNQSEDSITVLTNRGNGTYFREDYETGSSPRKVLLADVNGNGFLDAITLNAGTDDSDRISILLGTGTGRFDEPLDVQTPGALSSIAAADVNGNGHSDLVVALASEASVAILFGDGTGSFSAGEAFETGPSPVKVALGDLNGNGLLDLVVGNDNSTTPISVLLGLGDGDFEEPIHPSVSSLGSGSTNARDLILADLNGDGHLDIAYSRSTHVSVFLGDGFGTFDEPLTFSTEGTTPESLLAVDVTGDGVLDLLVANRGSANLSLLTVSESFREVIVGDCDTTPHAFTANVRSIFTEQGCVACHGGSEPDGNMDLATGDVHATLMSNQRVNLGNPENSRILTKPSGQVNHVGGVFFTRSSQEYLTILCWIEADAPND